MQGYLSTIQAPLMFVAAVFVLGFNYIVYIKQPSSRINQSFGVFGLSIFVWLFFFATAYCVRDMATKIFFFRMGYLGIIFIPITFFHFIYSLLGKRKDAFLVLNYILGLIFSCILFTKYSLVIGVYDYYWGFYPKTFSVQHVVFLSFFLSLFTLANISLAIAFFKPNGTLGSLKRQRLKYALLGSVVGSFGSLDFIGSYGINFLPIGFIFMFLYPLIFGYAILKYRFLEVTLVITRTSIFVAVYSFVLGIPCAFAIGGQAWLRATFGELWWLSPMILLTVMATGGPFIYLAIQRRAEEKLFQDQRRYQSTLRQASTGMGRIKDMDKLLDMIVRVVTRSVRIEHSFIYLNDRKSKGYKFEAARFRSERLEMPEEISADSRIVKALKKLRAPIVYSEVEQRAQDFDDHKLRELQKQMASLHAELVVPCFIEDKLISIMAMGKKVSGEMYSQDDLSVFMILSNQAGLAIENAQFYKDMRATHEQLFRAEKMATIGIMADGLSHQINNRLHALGFIAGDALDTIQMNSKLKMTEEVKEMVVDIEHALSRIQENVSQGGEIVRGLLKYSRKGDDVFGEVELDQLVDEAVTMAQFKIKTGEMSIVRDFETGLPKLYGNFTQLQEVFFNMIDNAYDAMMQRKADFREEGFKPTITITAERARQGSMRIVLEDNGIGIRAEDQEKVFTPFFTTKLSSKKGTGLGLYVIQKLIEENHKGKVFYKSEYGKGTRVYITLPTVEGREMAT